MTREPTVLERRALEHTREANMEHHAQQAAWHQHRALTSLNRVREHPSGEFTPDQRTDLLLTALREASSAWRLLVHAQEEVPTRAAAARIEQHLGQVSALAEDIERELYEPAGVGQPRAALR